MNNRTRKWLRAGLEVLIHGSAAAVISTLTAAFVDSKDWGLGTENFFKMLTGTFLGNGGIRFFQWWQANPLPPENDTVPPIPGAPGLPMISINPLAKVMPMSTFAPTDNPPADPAQPNAQ